jgi:hypothetical protein
VISSNLPKSAFQLIQLEADASPSPKITASALSFYFPSKKYIPLFKNGSNASNNTGAVIKLPLGFNVIEGYYL